MAAHTAERRPLGALGRMTMVAGIHAVALLLIARGLGIVPTLKFEKPITTRFFEDPTPPPPADPVPTPPRIQDQTVFLPPPDPIPIPVEGPSDAIAVVFRPIEQIPIDTGTAVVEAPPISVRPDPRHPLSQPPYPAEYIRGNIEGAVEVEVYVQPDGRVGDARIVKTSGYDAFDRNTLLEAKRKWRLMPATKDGSAVPQWYRMRVVFKLTKQ